MKKIILKIILIFGIFGIGTNFIFKNIDPDILNKIPFINGIIKNNQVDVTLSKCVDGDTAWFNIDGVATKVRFLYIDTPESTNTVEPYGKEASNFTCSMLSNASEIRLEYDGDKKDKYNRILAWIWADDILIQEEIAKNGYVEKFYDYGNYKYEKRVSKAVNDIYGILK
ncbi:MAG: thermonuclease family protein [Bacilli bacterium]